MKIDHLEVIHLHFDYPNRAGFTSAGGVTTGRLTSLVLVHTDTGETGIGSVYSHPGLVEMVVKGHLEPLLVGEDPREVETLWGKMYRWTRWYGRKGAAMSALGGLDMAFWDLRGKWLRKPLWELLGGDRPSCPAYASALLWKEPDELAADAAGHIAKGFRRVKMRLGRSEEYDAAAVRAVRRAIGARNDLMADASMRYNVELARRIGRVLEEVRAFWFEEPFEPEDDRLVRGIARHGCRAVGGGRERVRRAGLSRADSRPRGRHRPARRLPLRRHQRGAACRQAGGRGGLEGRPAHLERRRHRHGQRARRQRPSRTA